MNGSELKPTSTSEATTGENIPLSKVAGTNDALQTERDKSADLERRLEKAKVVIAQYRSDLGYIVMTHTSDYAARRLKALASETEGI